MVKQEKTMAAVLKVLVEMGDDPYDKISMSSDPRTLSKDSFATKYGVSGESLRCMISGTSLTSFVAVAPFSRPPKILVALSHLLPRCANASDMASLGYRNSDIEDIRNSVLLCKGFGQAFDHKYISFVPSDNPFSDNKYKLHIWSGHIKTEPIYQGASQTIGDFEGAPLILRVGTEMHNPFKRALSYQAFCAWKSWG